MREFFIKDNGPCCVEKAFKMIGARWTPRILELCYLHSGMDLREFRQELPTCPETTLSRRLRVCRKTACCNTTRKPEPMRSPCRPRTFCRSCSTCST